ncbi:hypothetical protein EXIGLDRAFT_165669 [Exidia glandulosa HHB12029]|uniref:Uncharacterized protein n=1 Tax=Exidia glandulosa HHB12029 TaxID=1314781 RepID=A0A165N4H9_EXIGL|nr:hypothetical protein EXIGLDRAFT_165669 [Exidia glandulosa HHB12029]
MLPTDDENVDPQELTPPLSHNNTRPISSTRRFVHSGRSTGFLPTFNVAYGPQYAPPHPTPNAAISSKRKWTSEDEGIGLGVALSAGLLEAVASKRRILQRVQTVGGEVTYEYKCKTTEGSPPSSPSSSSSDSSCTARPAPSSSTIIDTNSTPTAVRIATLGHLEEVMDTLSPSALRDVCIDSPMVTEDDESTDGRHGTPKPDVGGREALRSTFDDGGCKDSVSGSSSRRRLSPLASPHDTWGTFGSLTIRPRRPLSPVPDSSHVARGRCNDSHATTMYK